MKRPSVWRWSIAAEPQPGATPIQLMGLEALGPKPKTSRLAAQHRIHSYLQRGLAINRPNQVCGPQTSLTSRPPGAFLPGRDHGLVQPIGPGVAPVEYDWRRVQPRGRNSPAQCFADKLEADAAVAIERSAAGHPWHYRRVRTSDSRWDFLHDQPSDGRRFRVHAIVEDITADASDRWQIRRSPVCALVLRWSPRVVSQPPSSPINGTGVDRHGVLATSPAAAAAERFYPVSRALALTVGCATRCGTKLYPARSPMSGRPWPDGGSNTTPFGRTASPAIMPGSVPDHCSGTRPCALSWASCPSVASPNQTGSKWATNCTHRWMRKSAQVTGYD